MDGEAEAAAAAAKAPSAGSPLPHVVTALAIQHTQGRIVVAAGALLFLLDINGNCLVGTASLASCSCPYPPPLPPSRSAAVAASSGGHAGCSPPRRTVPTHTAPRGACRRHNTPHRRYAHSVQAATKLRASPGGAASSGAAAHGDEDVVGSAIAASETQDWLEDGTSEGGRARESGRLRTRREQRHGSGRDAARRGRLRHARTCSCPASERQRADVPSQTSPAFPSLHPPRLAGEDILAVGDQRGTVHLISLTAPQTPSQPSPPKPPPSLGAAPAPAPNGAERGQAGPVAAGGAATVGEHGHIAFGELRRQRDCGSRRLGSSCVDPRAALMFSDALCPWSPPACVCPCPLTSHTPRISFPRSRTRGLPLSPAGGCIRLWWLCTP